MALKNYNKDHETSGTIISGTYAYSITVGELRDAIASFPDDAEIEFGSIVLEGGGLGLLRFNRFKKRGPNTLQLEFNAEPLEG